jgi:GNAT superfamily N-acetyltransferase
MILHEITRDAFMVTTAQTIVPGHHDVQTLLALLRPPGWAESAVVPITKNPCYATAMAQPGVGAGLSSRPLENQVLLALDDHGSYALPVGIYIGEVIVIDPAHQGKGLSAELILRCCTHRDIPFKRTLTPAGKKALERAHHIIAVHNAHAAGCRVPAAVRADYGI